MHIERQVERALIAIPIALAAYGIAYLVGWV